MKKMNKSLVIFFLGLLFFCAIVFPVKAAETQKFVIGSEFELYPGETLRGDLIVIAGDVELHRDSFVDGDVILFGGELECGGKINGDLTAFGGDVELSSTAEVSGDLTGVGSEIDKEFGAVVAGNSLRGGSLVRGDSYGAVSIETGTEGFSEPQTIRLLNLIVKIAILMLLALISAALAVVVLALLKKKVRESSTLLEKIPWQSFLIGLGGFVIFLCVEGLLFITVFLIPLALLIAAAYLLLNVYGFVCVGHCLGAKLNDLLKAEPNEVLSTVFTVFILRLLTLVSLLFIPCFGFVPGLFLTFFSTGVAAARLLNFYPQNEAGEIKHYREGIKREIQSYRDDEDPLEKPEGK